LGFLWAVLCILAFLVLRGAWQGWVNSAPAKLQPPREIDRISGAGEKPSQQISPVSLSGFSLPNVAWTQIVFVDVETTGLTHHDRIVTLAAILFDASTLASGHLNLKVIHRIYNPGTACHPEASRIHGYSDSLLNRQPSFEQDAEEISEFLRRADLVVCHNTSFDLRFVNQALASCDFPPLSMQSYCTMENYRRQYDGSARLDSAIARFGLKRERGRHGAFEDAWLTMNLFLGLNGVKGSVPFEVVPEEQKAIQN
jgi:DNA polymerase-3 subunit epsilon